MPRIYLDHNASTPLAAEAFAAMKPYLSDWVGNASSLHWAGAEAKEAIEIARAQVARLIGVLPKEMTFTSGATESINSVLRGIFQPSKRKKTIRLNSAYRSPQYNQNLRDQDRTVAKASTHMEGMAADITIAGVDGKYLWEALRAKNCCGVGWYGRSSVHVDTGPARFWTGATSKVNTNISDHNKKILLRSDRDIYRAGDTMDLFIVRITEYPIGVKPQFKLVEVTDDKEKIIKKFRPQFTNLAKESKKSCLILQRREEGRKIAWQIPEKVGALREAPLHVRVDFCNKPHEEMPDFTLSNRIEIRS